MITTHEHLWRLNEMKIKKEIYIYLMKMISTLRKANYMII